MIWRLAATRFNRGVEEEPIVERPTGRLSDVKVWRGICTVCADDICGTVRITTATPPIYRHCERPLPVISIRGKLSAAPTDDDTRISFAGLHGRDPTQRHHDADGDDRSALAPHILVPCLSAILRPLPLRQMPVRPMAVRPMPLRPMHEARPPDHPHQCLRFCYHRRSGPPRHPAQ